MSRSRKIIATDRPEGPGRVRGLAVPGSDAARDRSRAGSGRPEEPPLRMAFLYVPNGVHMPDWTPRRSGAAFELPAILEPLQAVKDDLLVLSGLTLNPARALGDGGGDHARAMASFLTGRHPRKTDGADLRAGDLRRPGGRPSDRPCDPLPLAGDRLRGGQERRRMRPRL